MKILGIETSCDETAVCLIEASGTFDASFQFKILGNALISQTAVHAPYGGVFPNLAKREHSRNLVPLLKQVLRDSGNPKSSHSAKASKDKQEPNPEQIPNSKLENIQIILEREPELFERLENFLSEHEGPNIDAIAVTHGPGLEPALWVGVNFAKALSTAWNIPIVPVNHLEGHIAMSIVSHPDTSLYNEVSGLRINESGFPAIALVISGGHTELDLITEWPKFKTIGDTRDDAVGEAFDKVARMMGLPYPGGPHISALAEMSRNNAEHTRNDADEIPRPNERIHSFGRACKSASSPHESALNLPRPMIHEPGFDFSFSGLKTAVLRLVKDRVLSEEEKTEIAREFEDAATEVLVKKTMRAVEEYGVQTVLVGGGVSANTHIRLCLAEALAQAGVALLYPPPGFETDNALMIALAGYFHTLNKEFADPTTLRANGNLRLEQTLT